MHAPGFLYQMYKQNILHTSAQVQKQQILSTLFEFMWK